MNQVIIGYIVGGISSLLLILCIIATIVWWKDVKESFIRESFTNGIHLKSSDWFFSMWICIGIGWLINFIPLGMLGICFGIISIIKKD